MKSPYPLLTILFTILLGISFYVSVKPVSEICDPNDGCELVLNSKYAYLFGIKLSYAGTILFAILFALTIVQIKKKNKIADASIKTGVLINSIVAIYYLYIQEFVINSYCKYCLFVDFTIIITLVITIFYWKK